MSEADSHNKDLDLSEPVEAISSVPPDSNPGESDPGSNLDEDAWETVDFPGAMSIAAIPIAGESDQIVVETDSHVVSALAALNEDNIEMAASLETEFADRLKQLQQENGELKERIAQLEQDLSQQQIELQLEMARSLHTAPPVAPEPEVNESELTQELIASQERVSELLQELEFSKQTSQRQRILVETLTEQLESSQERIAQLERDCALAQQRYNEQNQQLLQTENTCRDLRMRLHRQQRQTLQFKAALEKCLEMPPAQRQSQFLPNLSLSGNLSAPVVPIPPTSLSQVLAPKNQPVRPWSAGSTAPADAIENASSDLPRPLSRLLHPPTPAEQKAEAPGAASVDSPISAEWVNQIFSDASANQVYPSNESPSTSNIFDLSPFLESGSGEAEAVTVSLENMAATSQPTPDPDRDEKLLQMLASVPLDSDDLGSPLEAFRWGQPSKADDHLWDDLAKLIDPPAKSEKVTPEVAATPEAATIDISSSGESTTSHQPTNPFEEGSAAAAISKKPLELISWNTRSSKPSRGSHLRPIETTSIPQADSEPETIAAESTVEKEAIVEKVAVSSPLSQSMVATSSPSPVLYPLRSSKKLKSLAAVDLPSFPKAK